MHQRATDCMVCHPGRAGGVSKRTALLAMRRPCCWGTASRRSPRTVDGESCPARRAGPRSARRSTSDGSNEESGAGAIDDDGETPAEHSVPAKGRRDFPRVRTHEFSYYLGFWGCSIMRRLAAITALGVTAGLVSGLVFAAGAGGPGGMRMGSMPKHLPKPGKPIAYEAARPLIRYSDSAGTLVGGGTHKAIEFLGHDIRIVLVAVEPGSPDQTFEIHKLVDPEVEVPAARPPSPGDCRRGNGRYVPTWEASRSRPPTG